VYFGFYSTFLLPQIAIKGREKKKLNPLQNLLKKIKKKQNLKNNFMSKIFNLLLALTLFNVNFAFAKKEKTTPEQKLEKVQNLTTRDMPTEEEPKEKKKIKN
jgi:hypothetical protein